MLLSTAAFANYGEATGDKETKLIDANVVGAGEYEQVVLLIVAKDVAVADATEEDIMYIDQKQADADGVAAFENIAIKDTETVVDIYVGSAATNGPQLIGDDIDVADVKVITLATQLEGDEIITANSMSAGDVSGFAAAITVNIPEGLTVDKMIWGFKLSNEEGRRYSTVQDVTSNTYGAVQFAAAFDIGYEVEATVESVSAIFLTGDKNDPANTHYTDIADKEYGPFKSVN
jgi:hypothetical protein